MRRILSSEYITHARWGRVDFFTKKETMVMKLLLLHM